MSTKRCLLLWTVRHAAWTVNCYVIHSDGYISLEHGWGRNYERAICQNWRIITLPSTATQEASECRSPNAETHMARKSFRNRRKCVATKQGVLKARTVRRLQPGFKCAIALLNKVSGTPWAPRGHTYIPSLATLLDTQLQSSEQKRRNTQDSGHRRRPLDETTMRRVTAETSVNLGVNLTTTTGQPQGYFTNRTTTSNKLPAPPHRQELRRMTLEEVMRPTRAQKTSKDNTIRSTEEATKDPQHQRSDTLQRNIRCLLNKRRLFCRLAHNLRQRRL